MDILFAESKLMRDCSELKLARCRWGDQCAKKILMRLQQLRASENLECARTLPQMRCHELKQNREGQLAVDLVHPMRLVFSPADDPPPRKPDGGLDWSRVTRIRVLEVVDYHD